MHLTQITKEIDLHLLSVAHTALFVLFSHLCLLYLPDPPNNSSSPTNMGLRADKANSEMQIEVQPQC